MMPKEFQPVVRRAVLEDAPVIAELAARTFSDTFAEFNNPEDMAAYMTEAYAPEQIAREIADPNSTYWLCEIDGQAGGYAMTRVGEAPECVTGARPFELVRLYVDKAWHGRGVAQALMSEYVAEAERGGFETLWLGVWEENHRAKGFYKKWGFVDVGEKVFVLGTDIQTDRVWTRAVRRAESEGFISNLD